MSIFSNRDEASSLTPSHSTTIEEAMSDSVDTNQQTPAATAYAADAATNRIEVSDLHIYYGDFLAVEDVNMMKG